TRTSTRSPASPIGTISSSAAGSCGAEPRRNSRALPTCSTAIWAYEKRSGMTDSITPIADPVPADTAGAREIGFSLPARSNASEVLLGNVGAGRGDRLAVTSPAGRRTYRELCDDAARWGNLLLSLGLRRGDRVLMFLDDTPCYPAAFFGAVRAGFVPLLINLLTPPDLLNFYLSDSGATVAVVEADFADRFDR